MHHVKLVVFYLKFRIDHFLVILICFLSADLMHSQKPSSHKSR
jgi:hypothetical protein